MKPARTFNPGALQNIQRFSAPQVIVPGSREFDFSRSGGEGRPLPLVGSYPSGAAPFGGALGDEMPFTGLNPWILAAVVGGLFWLSWTSKKI